MKKYKAVLADNYLERDADVVVTLSSDGDMLHLRTVSRYDPPVDLSARLTEAEKQLMKEMEL